MSTLSDLYSKKRKYKNLKSDITDIIGYIEKTINSIGEAPTSISNCYFVDEEKADKGKISSIKQKLQEQKKLLSNTIYPAIKEKIRKIENQITDEESS